MFSIKAPELRGFDGGIAREWLVANGVGGYSSSTVIGCNTRKYHGLLVASLEPPVKRRVLLSKVEEVIEADGKPLMLSTNEYKGGIYPEGYSLLSSFGLNPFPVATFNLGRMKVTRIVHPVYGHNAAVITYGFHNPGGLGFKFRVRPLITSRGIHEVAVPFSPDIAHENDYFISKTDETTLAMGCFHGAWSPSGLNEEERWYRDFQYRAERERGYPSSEDLYNPGEFVFESDVTSEFRLLCAGGGPNAEEEFREIFNAGSEALNITVGNGESRNENIQAGFHELTGVITDKLDPLVVASDSFIVKRQRPRGKSILAGYHWFADFGRDTFISLPGLTLITGRFEEAKGILGTFTRAISRGLVPNNFSEDGMPYYHGVDASLWYVYAAQKYLEYTGDMGYLKKLIPSLKAVLSGFIRGNALASVGEDGLISLNRTPRALTWMDVNVEGRHATPRFGKVVEMNALWFNALRFLGETFEELGEFNDLAAKVQAAFDIFWNPERGCLYDFVHMGRGDGSLRPNQIFALSLPYSPLDLGRGRSIMKNVQRELLTPYGLRSLDRNDPNYHPVYEGDQRNRDLAYHQGTVWSWLLGPFVTAFVKVNKRSERSKIEAEGFLEPLFGHLSDAGLGSISEIFDAEPPHRPRGCISQAWSVAEVLRAYCEDIVEVKRPFIS